MLIETEREKDIDIGVKYPFEPLKYGECLATAEMQINNKLEINDNIDIRININEMVKAMIEDYNDNYA